jgi:4-amino-4-deoxy-L-arabinose transferase-like glycosyltransferase
MDLLGGLVDLLPLIIPIAILQVALMVVALVDAIRRPHTRGPKWAWLLVIMFVNIFGPIIYLLFGRGEDYDGDTD